MGDGDASTGIALTDIALFVIWICDEDVLLAINHVCVEVVRATGGVHIIP